eukprot:47329-Chlamydomonas_euryale.AAC.2
MRPAHSSAHPQRKPTCWHLPSRRMTTERTERMGATLHMLEARNVRLADEAAALHDQTAALVSARNTLEQQRDALAEQLRLEKQVRMPRARDAVCRRASVGKVVCWWWSGTGAEKGRMFLREEGGDTRPLSKIEVLLEQRQKRWGGAHARRSVTCLKRNDACECQHVAACVSRWRGLGMRAFEDGGAWAWAQVETARPGRERTLRQTGCRAR